MLQNGFEIEVTNDSVTVRREGSFLAQRYGNYVGYYYMAGAALLFWWAIFYSHDRTSIWQTVTHYRSGYSDFGEAVAGLFCMAAVCGLMFSLGARTFFPSGELLHCDRQSLTVSRITWWNLRGHWTTRSYPLADISQLCFGVVIRSRGNNFDGLRFQAYGKKHKLFAGLEAPEAHKILKGLHALGVDVPDLADMHYLVDEALKERSMKLENR
jgi:hypothetical protein